MFGMGFGFGFGQFLKYLYYFNLISKSKFSGTRICSEISVVKEEFPELTVCSILPDIPSFVRLSVVPSVKFSLKPLAF